MARHSFIRMSKLPNVKGRIDYISSPDRQENLYATYQTADAEFWKSLAFESQQEFRRFGTEGKCIEARELIIALPEVYTTYDPQEVLKEFTEEFHKRYGVECVSALHHNKRKTNYHIHLIFSERTLLPEPDIKIASRSVFYDETGKRVRTKKEITGEDGKIRPGCTVIKKGEVYEQHICCPVINLGKVAVQLATEKQGGIDYRTMFLDVAMILSAPSSNRLGIFFVQYQTWDVIIPLQFIPKTVIIVVDVPFHGVILQDFYIRTYVTSIRLPHSVISFYQIFLPLFLPLWGVADKVNTSEIV